MSQNDYVIANDTAANVRADLNLALAALASQSSGATAPATTYANMIWYDTANDTLKMRSESNTAWITLGTLNQGTNTFTPAGLTNLSQVQVENAASTVFGQVSGQRLSQSVKGNLNATGSAPIYACRAWVNFDGTGTVAIRAAGNVSSITDNGTGNYMVNFTTSLPDANYAVVATNETEISVSNGFAGTPAAGKLTTSCVIQTLTTAAAAVDRAHINVAFLR